MSMRPTAEIRFLEINEKFPSGIQIPRRILQQKWRDEFDGRIEEWRDVPIVTE